MAIKQFPPYSQMRVMPPYGHGLALSAPPLLGAPAVVAVDGELAALDRALAAGVATLLVRLVAAVRTPPEAVIVRLTTTHFLLVLLLVVFLRTTHSNLLLGLTVS